MLKQSLLQRKPKSDVAGLFVNVLGRDNKNRPKVLAVPGSKAAIYHVILRREGRTVSTECRLVAGAAGFCNCQGNGRRKVKEQETICYHSRAAVDFAIEHKWQNGKWEKSGLKASWCVSYNDAKRLHKMLGGTIFNVKSYQNTYGWAYILVIKK